MRCPSATRWQDSLTPKRHPFSGPAAKVTALAVLVLASTAAAPTAQAAAPSPNRSSQTPAAPAASGNAAGGAAAPAGQSGVSGMTANVPQGEQPRLVAVVNREEIHREELGRECIRHYGAEVLDTLINRSLIIDHCRQQNITVTQKEINEEIERLAKKFQIPTDQYLKMLEKERGVKPRQYATDVVWPTLALRRLAAAQLKITPAELEQAYESQFGAAVKVRLILLTSSAKAKEVYALATAKPQEFGALARKHSEDPSSASANGMIQPIRRFLGEKPIEEAAFQLKEGEISPIITVGHQFVILKCEGHIKPTAADRQQVDPLLVDALKDRKLRTAGTELFKKLQSECLVENYLKDPNKGKQFPGLAARVNSHSIGMKELTDECIERHGAEVLEGTINRHLIEQALRRGKLEVGQRDIDAEIARAAISMGKTTRNGEADVPGWLDLITRQQGVTVDVYIRDSVWPTVALKKIVGNQILITEDDLRKGYEANFGPRVRCRAIVLSNLRKAQEVWEKARQSPTIDAFGKLAEDYSIEPNSRSLRGEVPPIQKYGGQPQLEKEAFSLEPGELSSIIQTGATYVILMCEGRTDPVKADFKEVRSDIYNDLLEKKMRIAMARKFEEMRDAAEVDNFLAGSIHSPRSAGRSLDDPSVKPASAQGGHNGGKGKARNPDMSVEELLKDNTPGP